MANVKISQLPSLSTMTNEAIVPVVAGGVTQQITGANLANFFSKISNGNSEANIGISGGNANISIGGVSNVAVFATTGLTVAGEISAPSLITNSIRADDSSFVNIEDGLNTSGAIIATGNVTGNYFIGNGSQLTGITAASTYGNANVAANLAALGSNPISTTGNITGGNILAGSGVISTGGNVNGAIFNGNVAFATGTVSGSGNITGGNIAVSGVLLSTNTVSATGNVTGGNINTGGNISTTGNVIALDIRVGPGITGGTISALGNITSANTLNGAGLSLSGNVVSALVSAANITTTANISGGNILGTHVGNVTGTTVSVTGNITGGNLNAAGLSLSSNVVSALVSAANITTTANISGGNILGTHVGNVTGTTVSATGNITGGNLNAAGLSLSSNVVSALNVTANIAGGNITTPGLISATGNITGGNILGGANVNATTHTGTTVSVTGNITGGNLTISGNTATVTSANYQIGYLEIPQISLAANTTANLTVSGKHYYSTSASNLALTIANNTSVVWPVGTAISIVNRGTANITIAGDTGVSLYLAGNSTAGNRVVTTYGMATVMNVAANIWMINGTVV